MLNYPTVKLNVHFIWTRKNSVFIYRVCLKYITLKTPPILNIRIQSYSYFSSKQSKTKEIERYYWRYLKINISEFRLILLDHVTYVKLPNSRTQCTLSITRDFFENMLNLNYPTVKLNVYFPLLVTPSST